MKSYTGKKKVKDGRSPLNGSYVEVVRKGGGTSDVRLASEHPKYAVGQLFRVPSSSVVDERK